MNIKLNKEILATGLKQGFIAKQVGITQVRFSRIIHMGVEPNDDEKRAIAGILEKPMRDLFINKAI